MGVLVAMVNVGHMGMGVDHRVVGVPVLVLAGGILGVHVGVMPVVVNVTMIVFDRPVGMEAVSYTHLTLPTNREV